jgi:ATP-binding cassette subfamily B protein
VGAITHIWPWLRPYRRLAALALFGTFVSVLINLSIPLQTARVIDDGIAADDSGVVARVVILMVVLIVSGMAVSAFTTAIAVRLAFGTITDLRRDLYDHVQSLSFSNLDRLPSGDLLTRLTNDMTKVQTVLTMGLSFIAQAPLMFIGSLAAIVALDAGLTVIVAVMVPIIAVIVWYVVRRSSLLYDAVQTRVDRMNNVLSENITGTEVVKAFVRQQHEVDRFDVVADDLAHQATQVNQLVASLMPTLIALSSLGIAAVVWLGGNNVMDRTLSEGDLVAFISYLAMVAMPLMIFAFVQPLLSAASASMARIDEVLRHRPDVPDVVDGIDLGSLPTPGDIRFEGVRFAYGASADDPRTLDNAALQNVDLHIRQGTTVAILGATGSGKSSLVHLVPRFYDTTAGTVRVGGVDVRELDKQSLRRNVGIALQSPQLFSGTVMENLRYGRPNATDAEVIEAAQTAQAHDFVEAMTNGYDSVIEQGGANLSGGQRQRLAIARTLVTDPAILILDDSTSAVDLETEAKIQEALATYHDRTVLIVAQRISTALGADEIVVLDDGDVCAHGTHDELIATNTVYQEIFASQLGEPVT